MSKKTEAKLVPFKIVVGTCEAYGSIVRLWHRAAVRYWPEAATTAILCTDQDPGLHEFPTDRVCARDSGWCDRLISCLQDCDEEFIVLVLDDYILEAQVDHGKILELTSLMLSNIDLGVIYLTDTGLGTSASNRSGLFTIQRGPYSINSCPGLWRRTFLLETLRHFNDPWAWEAFAFGTDVARRFQTACWGPTIYNYSFKTGGLVYRGAISREALARIDRADVLGVDLADLPGFSLEKQGDASVRSLAWKLKFLRTGFSISPITALTFIRVGLLARLKRLARKPS